MVALNDKNNDLNDDPNIRSEKSNSRVRSKKIVDIINEYDDPSYRQTMRHSKLVIYTSLAIIIYACVVIFLDGIRIEGIRILDINPEPLVTLIAANTGLFLLSPFIQRVIDAIKITLKQSRIRSSAQ